MDFRCNGPDTLCTSGAAKINMRIVAFIIASLLTLTSSDRKTVEPLSARDLVIYVLSSNTLLRSRFLDGQVASGWPLPLMVASRLIVVLEDSPDTFKELEQFSCSPVVHYPWSGNITSDVWLETPALRGMTKCKTDAAGKGHEFRVLLTVIIS